ncbi:MAG: ABC transporter substrate-binding protein, partial [Treponema sp.]|nr:ABC transporter substrate-binding protein [Treponema sp.]
MRRKPFIRPAGPATMLPYTLPVVSRVLQNRVMLLFFFLFATGFIFARGASGTGGRTLTIYSLKGSPGVGMLRLFEEPPEIRGFNVKVEALAQADLMAARFISGEARVGILPPNMAAKIASSGIDVRAAAVVGTGMLSLLSADPELRGLPDLRGKTVEVAGQGATPDYVFRKILSAHDLVPEIDVKLGYSLPPPEIAQSLIAGKISTALLPEPFATMAQAGRQGLRLVVDIQEEWAALGHSGNYPMTVLVMDGGFADANSEAAGDILNAVRQSIEWVCSRPVEAGALAEKYDLGFRAAVAAVSIPKSGYVFIPSFEARQSL